MYSSKGVMGMGAKSRRGVGAIAQPMRECHEKGGRWDLHAQAMPFCLDTGGECVQLQQQAKYLCLLLCLASDADSLLLQLVK